MKKRLILSVAVLVLAVGAAAWAWHAHGTKTDDKVAGSGSSTQQNGGSNSGGNSGGAAAPSGFNKSQYSLSEASSPWVVVNKLRPLSPKTYVPADLVVPTIPLRSNITSTEKQVSNVMAGPLETMVAAAKQTGLTLDLESGYRSYNFQVNLYNGYVKQQGQATADTQSARPGFSEHQTGLAADLGGSTKPSCNVAQCFATTPEGIWLAANAYKYGFVIRYPDGLTSITGYEYEPWHVRYVGTTLSSEMHTEGVQTLEQFFGLPAAPDYQ